MTISKALVFDIKRFAVHDGDGIRTTVFFKGCPLRCRWCQNPEGLSLERRPLYFEKNCIHCRRCEQFSYENQIEYKNNRPYFHKDYKNFDNIIKACPSSSIIYDSEEYSVEELLHIIKEDEVFHKFGGGVTFSGGEPLLQGEFLLEILKRCKDEGIHTAIETSFYASLDFIKELLPYLDLLYIDLKVYDEKLHKEYTGVSSKKMKENIEYVLKSSHKQNVIIRTPLIPTMSATDDNIKAISEFLYDIDKDVRYELLNYNPLASSKYDLVDLEYGVDEQYKMFTKEEMNHFYDIILKTGIKNIIKE